VIFFENFLRRSSAASDAPSSVLYSTVPVGYRYSTVALALL
jgi:hypothetical protein